MKFLRFGDTTINIARAIRIDDSGDAITVDFVASDNPLTPLNVRFEGQEAVALRDWLGNNADDLTHHDQDDTGRPLDGPRPYISPR